MRRMASASVGIALVTAMLVACGGNVSTGAPGTSSSSSGGTSSSSSGGTSSSSSGGSTSSSSSSSSSGAPGPACTTTPSAVATNHRATATACPPSTNGVADGCLSDSDCTQGDACACASQFGGNAPHANACIATGCRVDADCGPGGFCSPSTGERCGGLSGYFCHTPSDCCTNDSDCPSGQACRHDPTLGSWRCEAISVCNG